VYFKIDVVAGLTALAADSAGVKNVAVFGDGQARHRLVPFGEPVKKLVEFGFVQRLPESTLLHKVMRGQAGFDQSTEPIRGSRPHCARTSESADGM
jgi:hypothetical protein